MKLSCTQENLSRGLRLTSHLTGIGRTNLPILNNVLLTAKKGFLQLSTTNLEVAIETKIRAKVEEEDKTTIPAQLFSNYIDLLPADEIINLEVVQDELTIECESQKTKIKGLSAEEFPIIPQVEKREKYVINAESLKKALEQTIFTVSQSETRVEISGALFIFNAPKENSLTIVGTDSYRLAEKTIPLKEAGIKEKREIIFPIKTLQEFLKIIKDAKESDVELYLAENQVLFIWQDTELTSRLISGEYPDYKQIIPTNTQTKILVDKEKLIKAIKSASLFAKSGVDDIGFKILPEKGEIVVSSCNNQVGENRTILKADISGEPNEITFNWRYLTDGLINLSDDEVGIEIVNDDTPALIKSPNDQSYLYLIMPIKGN